MATYNGEKYLDTQIYSLLSQTYRNWRLIVHDDGSTDNSISILKKFVGFDERISLIEDGVKFGNASNNFMHLLKYSNSPLIVFCDQDDVWFDSKLEQMVDLIKQENGPSAVYCNAFAYNGTKITSPKVTLFQRTDLRDSLFLNSGVQGCSLLFNKALLDEVRYYPLDKVVMHDHLFTIAAVSLGRLFSIEKSLMLYRQHSTNVTGSVPTSFLDRFVTSFKYSKPVLDRRHYLANEAFYNTFKHKLSQVQRNIFLAYLKYPGSSLFIRIMIVIKYRFKIGHTSLVLLLKTLIRKPIC